MKQKEVMIYGSSNKFRSNKFLSEMCENYATLTQIPIIISLLACLFVLQSLRKYAAGV